MWHRSSLQFKTRPSISSWVSPWAFFLPPLLSLFFQPNFLTSPLLSPSNSLCLIVNSINWSSLAGWFLPAGWVTLKVVQDTGFIINVAVTIILMTYSLFTNYFSVQPTFYPNSILLMIEGYQVDDLFKVHPHLLPSVVHFRVCGVNVVSVNADERTCEGWCTEWRRQLFPPSTSHQCTIGHASPG